MHEVDRDLQKGPRSKVNRTFDSSYNSSYFIVIVTFSTGPFLTIFNIFTVGMRAILIGPLEWSRLDENTPVKSPHITVYVVEIVMLFISVTIFTIFIVELSS